MRQWAVLFRDPNGHATDRYKFISPVREYTEERMHEFRREAYEEGGWELSLVTRASKDDEWDEVGA